MERGEQNEEKNQQWLSFSKQPKCHFSTKEALNRNSLPCSVENAGLWVNYVGKLLTHKLSNATLERHRIYIPRRLRIRVHPPAAVERGAFRLGWWFGLPGHWGWGGNNAIQVFVLKRVHSQINGEVCKSTYFILRSMEKKYEPAGSIEWIKTSDSIQPVGMKIMRLWWEVAEE